MQNCDPDIAEALGGLSDSDRFALLDFFGISSQTRDEAEEILENLQASIALHRMQKRNTQN